MEQGILEIERLCQEKILLFQEMLSVFQKEKKTIISADIGSLWVVTRQKQDISNKIKNIREHIMASALESGILDPLNVEEYSLLKIISALPNRDKGTLANLRVVLNGLKSKIAALAHENRKYLEESMKTVEDLLQIIIRNCDRDERYGRNSYLNPSLAKRAHLILGEV